MKRSFRIWRGNKDGGKFEVYDAEVDEGMVVLDMIHRIQAIEAPDLACRWNCKAGKCGSCSMEINGKPRLACMTRMNSLDPGEVKIQPVKSFPIIKDLVTDVSWNYRQNRRIRPLQPRPRDADGNHRMYQEDVDRIQEFRKCIECYLCQNVCHVVRDRDGKEEFIGPRFMIRVASLEMHPLDTDDRIPELRKEWGSGMCNITKCCTEVCPEHINITDNGIIPMKERVVDRYFDPLIAIARLLTGKKVRKKSMREEAQGSPQARAATPGGVGAAGAGGPRDDTEEAQGSPQARAATPGGVGAAGAGGPRDDTEEAQGSPQARAATPGGVGAAGAGGPRDDTAGGKPDGAQADK